MKIEKYKDSPFLYQRAEFKSQTFNESEKTVEVVFSTGARVLRGGFFNEPFHQELAMEPENVRLERLNLGAPVLNNHNSFSLSDVVGVVESARMENGLGIATLRFSEREEVKAIVQDVKDGILRNISVGFQIHKLEELPDRDEWTGYKVFMATDWEPFEISLVGMPADAGAQIRSVEKNVNKCEIISRNLKESEMPKEEKEILEPQKEIEVREVEVKVLDEEKLLEARKQAAELERTRIADIALAARAGKLSDEEVEGFVNSGATIDEVRSFVIEKLAKEDNEMNTRQVNVEVTRDENETRKKGMEEAILHRVGGLKDLTEEGKEYRNLSLVDMAKECLERKNISTRGMNRNEIAGIALGLDKRAGHSTSDFPEILANVQNKSLRAAYEVAPQTFLPFTRLVTVSDFKEISRTQLGEGSALLPKNEKQEYQSGTVSEGAEKYSVKDYGRLIKVSRQMIVNDDLSAFGRLPSMLGQRARDLESDLVWSAILANANMADGNALFSTAHANIDGTGAVISVASLGAARSAMRKQTGLDGQILSVQPVYLYVPPELETVGEQFISQIVPDASGNVNPFSSTGRTPLRLGVEPRLSDASFTGFDVNAWYLFAELAQIDMMELARLEGEEGPMIESMVDFDTDCIKTKVRHTVGAKAIDWRGMYKNIGA